MSDDQFLRMVEALLFASGQPLSTAELKTRVPEDVDLDGILESLVAFYEPRGVNLVNVGGKWQFRTAPDLAFLLRKEVEESRKLSRAAVETLAIIAYHQPVTRAEIEDIRGVSLSKGTLDVLMEAGWIKPRGRKKIPGRPLTYGTTDDFLIHFGLETIKDLPGLEDLKAAGLLDHVNLGVLDFKEPGEKDDDEPELPLDGDEEGDADLSRDREDLENALETAGDETPDEDFVSETGQKDEISDQNDAIEDDLEADYEPEPLIDEDDELIDEDEADEQDKKPYNVAE